MGMLEQAEIVSTKINTGNTFPDDLTPGNLISTTTFTSIGLGSHRKIRTHISLNVDDVSNSTPKNIFITLYDGFGNKLKNFSHAYNNNLCTSLNFYHYSSITPGVQTTFYVYALCSSNSVNGAYISNNSNTYSSLNVAPTSYVTIEDIGVA
jgi:hypothetical protein